MKFRTLLLALIAIFSLDSKASEAGENYFKAVVFGDGKIADAIPEIRENYHIDLYAQEADSKKQIRLVMKDVVKQIHLTNPGYFDEVERLMHFRNPVVVSRVIDDMYFKTYASLKEIYPNLEKTEKIVRRELMGSQQSLTVAAAVVAVAAAAVHNVVAVTSMAAVVVAVKVKVAVDARADWRQKSLMKEETVRSLIQYKSLN